MATAHQQIRAVIEQMYSAVGLARSLNVPPIDADGLFMWAATLDACLQQQPDVVDPHRTIVGRDGWDCAWCGHRHAGRAFGYVCIGCACEYRPVMEGIECSH